MCDSRPVSVLSPYTTLFRSIDPRDFMEKVKRKEDGIRLMGFGHRVYKNYDPRARIVKAIADDALESLGVHDSRLELAMKLEEIAQIGRASCREREWITVGGGAAIVDGKSRNTLSRRSE